jgi:ATP-binding cassette subfamily C protein CydCD
MFRPFREMSQLFHQGMVGLSAAQGIFSLMDAEPSVREPKHTDGGAFTLAALAKSVSHHIPSPLEGEGQGEGMSDGATPSDGRSEQRPYEKYSDRAVEFSDVTFSYPGSSRVALDHVSFALRPGERIGIAGESGAGKTSIIKLLLRFYDPQSGRVMLGGRDVRDLTFDQLRSQIAVVSQDTYLFHGTVNDNLRFGKPDATPRELEDAARAANAHEFIARLPNGYDTVIGERGVRLSGGQRQRVAIARALLRDSPLLVLDEALSAVDAENEHIIQEALDRLMAGRTTLIIAHRLSSLRDADRILVLHESKLVETGGHEELVSAGGPYAALMAEQAFETESAAEVFGESSANGRTPEKRAAYAEEPQLDAAGEAAQLAPTDAILKAEGMGWVTASRVLLRLIAPWKLKLSLSFITGVLRFVTLIGVGVVSALTVAAALDGDPFGWLLATLFILAPVSALLHWAESWVSHDVAFRLLSEMRIALYSKLEQLAPAYLVRRRTGDLVSMATQDVETVEYFFAHVVAPAFVAVVVPTGVLVTLLFFGWQMALALLPFLALVALSPLVSRNRVDRLGARSREHLGELNAHVVDTVQGMHEVAAFQRGESRGEEFIGLARGYVRVRVPFFRELTLQKVFLEAATGFGGLTVAVAGASLVSDGSLDAGHLPLATLIAMAAFLPVSEIANVGRLLADTLGSTRRIYAVQLEPVPVTDGPGVARAPARLGNSISFSHVEFSYDYSNRPALSDVTFDIPAGKTVALVGPSGAGKTTAAHLVMRFWDPATGAITLNGHDLREYGLDDLRRLIALVAQDTYLFNSSLRQNLLVAKPDASDAEIDAAIDMAGLRSFVGSLPDGLETTVGERGAQLSGGQRQRVAIGRAFLKDAPILVLDEATSHLDATNERLVRDALDKLMSDRTTLVIAHRLSTVRDADIIVALDAGRVVEVGSHDELIARRGLYAGLVASQLQAR